MIRPDALVLGTGFAGLTCAIRLTEAGYSVACCGDGVPGTSVQNFGQLHSGAVYGPVLPKVAAACWEHRSRWEWWLNPESYHARGGLALFAHEKNIGAYEAVWDQLRIPFRQVGSPGPQAAAAYSIPDITVDTACLYRTLLAHAHKRGVEFSPVATYRLLRAGTTLSVGHGSSPVAQAPAIVLAAGHRTIDVLNDLGVQHPLRRQYLPYGHLPSRSHHPLTYWLDADLLAISPTPTGLHLALPGRSSTPPEPETTRTRLRAAAARHSPTLDTSALRPSYGVVAEPEGEHPDPTVLVADLSEPPAGWGPEPQLITCLPGKWTTAWHAADLVTSVVAART